MSIKIDLDFNNTIPLYLQIKNGVKGLISSGTLQVGDRLPATRDLARQLGVNRTTVTNAYEELLADGLLSSHVGQGTFVAAHTSENLFHDHTYDSPQKMVWEGLFAEEAEDRKISALRDLYQVSTISDVISFSGSFPDENSFPVVEFKNSLNYALRQFGRSVLKYEQAAGLEALREHLVKELTARGIAAASENILITNGSQQSIDLLARAFIEPGDLVIVENPTYPGASNSFTAQGARLLGVPVDSYGMQTDYLEQVIARQRPKLIYTIPTFHNPTGVTLSLERRNHLVSLARQHSIPILEDAYGEDLRFEGDELPALKNLDKTDQIIYFGTFSKNLLPGIRIGWCLAPTPVFTKLVGLKQISDVTTSPLLQAALWDFCRRGKYLSHLERVRQIYKQRCDFMSDCLKKYFPPDTIWNEPEGGLFCWVKLPSQIDATELLMKARQEGVVFSRGHLFHIDGSGQNTLRLSFGNLSKEEIERGLKILGGVASVLMNRKQTHTPDKFLKDTLPLV